MTSIKRFIKNTWDLFALVALMAAALFGSNYWINAVLNLNEKTYLKGEPFAREAFSGFVGETAEHNDAGPLPARVWRGDTSKVLAVAHRRLNGPLLTVYAETEKGAFFEVSYAVEGFAPLGVKGAKRLFQMSFRPLTPAELKIALFEAKKFDAYRALFGEPPKEKTDA